MKDTSAMFLRKFQLTSSTAAREIKGGGNIIVRSTPALLSLRDPRPFLFAWLSRERSTFYLNRTTADKSTSYRRDLISTHLYEVPACIPLCETESGYQIAKWSVCEVAPDYLTILKRDFYFQVRQNVSLVWSNKLWIFCWSVCLSQLKALPGLDAHVLGKRKLSSSHKRIREGKWLPCTRRVLGFSRI